MRNKILDTTLFITQFELKSPFLAHAIVLGMKCKACYPVTHTPIKTFTSSSGPTMSLSMKHSLAQFQKKKFIAFLKTTAFVDSAGTNPFHFHHYVMINLVLYVNGVQYPADKVTTDCSSPFGATRAYETLFSSTGIHHDDRAHMITLEMFTKGFYLLGFDLTPDRGANGEHLSLPR